MEGIKGTLETLWPGGGIVSAAAALYSFPNPSSHTMAVEAAIEALRATLDLVSQTKMRAALQALRSFDSSPNSERGLFFFGCFFLNLFRETHPKT